jgi:hypothetical protein
MKTHILLLAGAIACGNESRAPATDHPARAPSDRPTRTAGELVAELATSDQAAMARYDRGVRVTGSIKAVREEVDGTTKLWIAADGDRHVIASFIDGGQRARARKVGDVVALDCQTVVGDGDRFVMIQFCALEP